MSKNIATEARFNAIFYRKLADSFYYRQHLNPSRKKYAMIPTSLILASSSSARKSLLEKLDIPFTCAQPDINEELLPNESVIAACTRLALTKAQAVANNISDTNKHLIIASDQIATCRKLILNKPLTADIAFTQLSACSGNKVSFYTSLCLLNTHTKQHQLHVERFNVYFKELSQHQIAKYIEKDQPLHCAGSFKAESLGVALFKKMEGDDPNSLIGLPLFKLIEFLNNEGVDVLS